MPELKQWDVLGDKAKSVCRLKQNGSLLRATWMTRHRYSTSTKMVQFQCFYTSASIRDIGFSNRLFFIGSLKHTGFLCENIFFILNSERLVDQDCISKICLQN